MDELKKKCDELKEKYFHKSLNGMLKRKRDIFRNVVWKDMYSEEELERLLNELSLDQEQIDELETEYMPESFSYHNAKNIDGDFDVEKVCSDMRTLEYEVLRFLMFDCINYIGYIEASGKETYIDYYATKSLVERVVKEYPNCTGIITIHNHPLIPAAKPSDSDGRTAMNIKPIFTFFEIRYIDDCIMSVLDFYSRRQEETGKTKDLIINENFVKLSDKLVEEIKKENKYLAWSCKVI